MNKTIRATLALFSLLVFSVSANAQDIRHSFGGWLGGGYTNFLNSISDPSTGYDFKKGNPGGGGFLGGVGYQLSNNNFLAVTGVEFSYLNSSSKLGDLSFSRDWKYTALPEDPNHIMTWNYDFKKYGESQSAGFLQIPLLAGMKFGERYFFLAGGKFGLNMMGSYKIKGNYSTSVTDGQLIGELEGVPPHYIVANELLGTEALNQTNNKVAEKGVTGDLKFQTNVILSAEFGVTLDEWILPPPPRRRRGTRAPEPLRPTFRASVFVDYGLLNINRVNSINPLARPLIDYYTTGEGENRRVNTPLDLEVSSLFNSNLAHKKNVNSLMAGVKLTVFMPTKQKPPKKPVRKPPVRKPPVARPPKPKPVAPLFYAKIYDKETNATLSANYQLIDTKSKKEILTGVTETTSGFIQSELKNGNYSLLVNKDGYLYYETPVTTIKGDTLLIALQPIKKEVKVVLNNLFFDVDKWVIKAQSQPTLDDLYLFLTDNPTVKIHITGHTDSSGVLKHNMTLSENRAKAVVEWLVKEGIDKSRLSYEGKGPNEPVDTNDTAEGKANNRRVEFVIK